eukprot:g6960.t1
MVSADQGVTILREVVKISATAFLFNFLLIFAPDRTRYIFWAFGVVCAWAGFVGARAAAGGLVVSSAGASLPCDHFCRRKNIKEETVLGGRPAREKLPRAAVMGGSVLTALLLGAVGGVVGGAVCGKDAAVVGYMTASTCPPSGRGTIGLHGLLACAVGLFIGAVVGRAIVTQLARVLDKRCGSRQRSSSHGGGPPRSPPRPGRGRVLPARADADGGDGGDGSAPSPAGAAQAPTEEGGATAEDAGSALDTDDLFAAPKRPIPVADTMGDFSSDPAMQIRFLSMLYPAEKMRVLRRLAVGLGIATATISTVRLVGAPEALGGMPRAPTRKDPATIVLAVLQASYSLAAVLKMKPDATDPDVKFFKMDLPYHVMWTGCFQQVHASAFFIIAWNYEAVLWLDDMLAEEELRWSQPGMSSVPGALSQTLGNDGANAAMSKALYLMALISVTQILVLVAMHSCKLYMVHAWFMEIVALHRPGRPDREHLQPY